MFFVRQSRAMSSGQVASSHPAFNLHTLRPCVFFGFGIISPMKRITRGFRQGASTAIVDGRKTGITMQGAELVVRRVVGKLGKLPGTVEIWTKEGILRR
jgi:hypothetical protein